MVKPANLRFKHTQQARNGRKSNFGAWGKQQDSLRGVVEAQLADEREHSSPSLQIDHGYTKKNTAVNILLRKSVVQTSCRHAS